MDEFSNKQIDDNNKAEGFVRIPEKGDGKVFTDIDEMLMAYQNGAANLHARVKGSYGEFDIDVP